MNSNLTSDHLLEKVVSEWAPAQKSKNRRNGKNLSIQHKTGESCIRMDRGLWNSASIVPWEHAIE